MPKYALSPENTEKFIEVVRQHPVIYDKKRSGRNANTLTKTWTTVAKIMAIQGKDGEAYKHFWRNLRDTFVKKRKIRPGSLGPDGVEYKPWKYFEKLSFLEDFVHNDGSGRECQYNHDNIRTKHAESTATVPQASDVDHTVELTGEAFVEDNAHIDSSVRVVHLDAKEPMEWNGWTLGPIIPNKHCVDNKQTERTAKRQKTDCDLQESVRDLIDEHKRNMEEMRSKTQKSSESKSAEDLFFESCALRMKQLPPATQSLLQLQISQLFYNAENPDVPPVTVTPSSSHQTDPTK